MFKKKKKVISGRLTVGYWLVKAVIKFANKQGRGEVKNVSYFYKLQSEALEKSNLLKINYIQRSSGSFS